MKHLSIELNRSRSEIAHADAYPSRDRARGQALVTELEEEQTFQVDLSGKMIITDNIGRTNITI